MGVTPAWKRTWIAVWIANLATAMGMMSFLPFFASHLEELGMRDPDQVARWTGLLFGAAPLSAAFMSPIWGALGDRLGRRAMVLRSMLAITVFVGAMAFARTPGQLLALRLLQGLFSGFIAPSLTLVSVQAPAHVQGRVASSMQVAMIWGAILGPTWGELARGLGGVPAVYGSVAALALVSTGLVMLFAHEDPASRRAHSGPLRTGALLAAIAEDWRDLRAKPSLRVAFALSFWLQFAMNTTLPLLELYQRTLSSSLGWARAGPGALFSATAVANLVAAPIWGARADRRGPYRSLILCALCSAAALAINGAATSYEWLIASRVLLGVAFAGAGPLAFGVAAAETGVDRRGGAIGLLFASRTLAVALAAFSGGLLAEWLSIRGLFLLSGALVGGYLALFARSRSRVEAST